MEYLNRIYKGIWEQRLEETGRPKAFLIGLARFILLSIRCTREEKIGLQASALTLYTLLSIVPVMAVLFAIAKGFEVDQFLQKEVMGYLSGHEEIANKIVEFSHRLLESTRGGIIAGFGILFLLLSSLKVFGNIEESFNSIWKVSRGRPVFRKLTDYVFLIFISPFVLVLSSAGTVLVQSYLQKIPIFLPFIHHLDIPILKLLKLLPLFILAAFFTTLYIFMPNTKVRFWPGVVGGLISSVICQAFQLIYIEFQLNISRYNAVYGSFAALPLFIVWLQVSWMIVLWGCIISYSIQNLHKYQLESLRNDLSIKSKLAISLELIVHLLRHLRRGNSMVCEYVVASELDIPFLLLQQIADWLDKAGVIVVSNIEGLDKRFYRIAKDPNILTVFYVIESLVLKGKDYTPTGGSEQGTKFNQLLGDMLELLRESPHNQGLRDLLGAL